MKNKLTSWEEAEAILKPEYERTIPALADALTKNRALCDTQAMANAIVNQSKDIDAACRFFAKHLRWPSMPPLLALCVISRLRSAKNPLAFLRGRTRHTFLVPSPRC